MAALYSELVIDGVIGDIYDKTAIHTDQLFDALVEQFYTSSFRDVIREAIFPVGSVYFGPDPTDFLGGRWTLLPDIMIVGAGNKYIVGATGGSADAVVVSHTHSGIANSSGAHTHTVSGSTSSAGSHGHPGNGWTFSVYKGTRVNEDVGEISGSKWRMSQVTISSGGTWSGYGTIPAAGVHTHTITGTAANNGAHTHTLTTNASGVSGVEKNMPPYKAFNIWERTA